jgi:hypothetical protein
MLLLTMALVAIAAEKQWRSEPRRFSRVTDTEERRISVFDTLFLCQPVKKWRIIWNFRKLYLSLQRKK